MKGGSGGTGEQDTRGRRDCESRTSYDPGRAEGWGLVRHGPSDLEADYDRKTEIGFVT